MKSDIASTSATAGTDDQGSAEAAPRGRRMPPLLKLAVELGPFLLFIGAIIAFDIWTATKVFMGAMPVALVVAYVYERRIPLMLGVTVCLVLVMGGLTLVLGDETFIKMKPTVVDVLLAAILLTGLAFRRLFIKVLLSEAMKLDDRGWRKLTIAWSGFFLFLALLNEVIWRNFSTEFWATFKIWGVFPLTVLFGAAQVFLVRNHFIESPGNKEHPGRD